jgi:simple sugar transport system permease protein
MARRAVQVTFGTSRGIEEAAVLATPLLLTGLGVALGLRMGLWNVGVEGQLFMGAWAATGVGLFVRGPEPLLLTMMFVAAALAGALWVLIPALARAQWNISEILTTLLLNFVAIYWVTYFTMGPWRDTVGAVLTATFKVPYTLPRLVGPLTIGILIAIFIAILLSFALRHTRWGYEISIIGGNRRAAEFAGMPVTRHILTTLLLSGGVAGIAGAIEIAGTMHRLSSTISNGYGYLGIVVCALGNASPVPMIVIAYLLASLLNAGIVLQTQGLSVNAMLAVNGLILIFAAVGEMASQYQIVRKEPEEISPVPSSHQEFPAASEGKARLRHGVDNPAPGEDRVPTDE